MAGSSSQNQGMLIAMIIFVILMVISMGLAVLFMSQTREMDQRLRAETAKANSEAAVARSLQDELIEVKNIIMAAPSKGETSAKIDDIRKRYEADLAKFGDRLKTIDKNAVTTTYTQILDAALTILEKKIVELNAATALQAQTVQAKDALEGIYKKQVDDFRASAEAAIKEKGEAQLRLASVDKELQASQAEVQRVIQDGTTKLEALRAEKQKIIDEKDALIRTLQIAIEKKDEFIHTVRTPDYAASFDGQITRVNPASRTVWINVGTFDNLKKHISFSVQPQGIPAGSAVPPKAKIEVVKLLDAHLAECRIVEDDLKNPIMAGENIYTNLWDPGQKTRFGFAGKIDLNDDGTEDMEEVHGLVARAGGQIDVEVINGVKQGELSIYTRYLVVGAIPADKESARLYQELLDDATRFGVQRIPLPVFMDQIGYPKRDNRRVVFGAGSQSGTVAMDPPDGGQRVSSEPLSPAFMPRRAPAAPSGTAY